jgi:endonuclease/exonuclease/phosphatase (EEP) superfamily protein YafD
MAERCLWLGQTGVMRNRSEWDSPRSVGSAFFDVIAALIIAGGALTVVTRFLGWNNSTLIVLAHAALPVVMLPVWFALAIAAWRGQPIRFAAALLLCAVHALSLWPAMGTDPIPSWAAVDSAPASDSWSGPTSLRVGASNVYVDNTNDLSSFVTSLAADVLVFTEFAKPIEALMERSGSLDEFVYRSDNAAEGTWRTKIFSRYPFVGQPRIVAVPGTPIAGTPLLSVDVELPSGGKVRVIGVHPIPLTVSGSRSAFANTSRVLREELRAAQLEGIPLIAVGDFNGTRWLPQTGELFEAGFRSAHESAGYGLSASWPRGGPFPTFMRLDHALYVGPVEVRSVGDVTVQGSDHSAVLVEFVFPNRAS